MELKTKKTTIFFFSIKISHKQSPIQKPRFSNSSRRSKKNLASQIQVADPKKNFVS